MLPLLFWVFCPLSLAEFDSFPFDRQFLHKTPSAVLEKLFTLGREKEIALNFDVQDSQEDAHIEVKRSAEVRIAELGGKNVTPQDIDQATLGHSVNEADARFDLPIYDFMVPAGQHKNSSLLALVTYRTKKTEEPKFLVTMDRLKWFEIGHVKMNKAGDSKEYEVPIMLVAGADVRPELTKNSVYKFGIEAHGENISSSRIRVEVFSFSPTTKRVKPTTVTEEIENTTATAASVLTTTGSTSEAQTTATTVVTNPPTTDISPSITAEDLETTTVEEGAEENKTTEEPSVTEAVADVATDESEGTVTEKEETEDFTTIDEATPQIKSDISEISSTISSDFTEGSGGVPTTIASSESSEEENPLTEVVTVATPIVQGKQEIDLNVTGLTEDVYSIQVPLSRGDLLRGLVISAARKLKSKGLLSISVDRPEFFSVRPKVIESGGKAYLFSNHPGFSGDVRVKVVVEDGDIKEEQAFVVKNIAKKDQSSIRTMTFNVSEDSPSGTVVGKVGEDMKIVGKPGMFALVGSDIVLSCASEAPCLDYEIQHVHYLLLASRSDPTVTSQVTIQVGDVNDHSPSIETTDAVIRVSDGVLIMPFAVQVADEDSHSVQENILIAKGPAAEFLSLEKIDADLYQIKVKGPSSPGRYDLVLNVSDGVHHNHKKTIRVLVQNSQSHAHFRRGRYERSLTAERLRPGAEVARVELEGVPIDEARFVVLKGNPGWLSVDDYGGTVTFTRPTRNPSPGVYEATVAALGRESGRILAQTVVAITIVGPPTAKKIFEKSIFEKTMDRESSPEISIILETPPGTTLEIDKSSVLAIDENGQIQPSNSEDVSISGNVIAFAKSSVVSLRVLRLEVTAGEERATVVIHLTSSDEFLEHRRKMRTRPQFPILPAVIEIPEELPMGHVLATIPAIHPESGEFVETRVEGGEGAFDLDARTGDLKIRKTLDYDDLSTPREFDLKITAGEEGYETSVALRIRLLDVDDNPPVISRDSLPAKIVIPENLPVATAVTRLSVADKDEISLREGLSVSLSGSSSRHFRASIANGTVTVQVAEDLDREKSSQHPLLLTVSDLAGHRDSVPILVSLSDLNDNSPRFLKDIYNVQAVENWPSGLVLETIRATDEDSQERGELTYSLESLNSKYFSLNATTGELFISMDLMGLAMEEPYLLTAVASDGGSPPRNTSVPIRITVSEPKRPNTSVLHFLTPPPGYILSLKGDLKLNEKVYQAKARADGDARNVKYSIQELPSSAASPFGIDELSGEIIVTHAPTRRSSHVLLLTARHLHSGASTTRLTRAKFTPSSRPAPFFPEGSPFYFPFHKNALIGRIEASTEDSGPVFYYLIPSCSPSSALFTVNASSGELFHSGPDSPKTSRMELCVLSTTAPLSETASLLYRPNRRDMASVVVVHEADDAESLPDLFHLNNTVFTIDRQLSSLKMTFSDPEIKFYNFSIEGVSFTPSETVLPLTTAAPLPSLFAVDTRGIVRSSPTIATQPSGVYAVHVEAKAENGEVLQLEQEFHLVPPSARLRFIFDRRLSPLSKDFPSFSTELQETISKGDLPHLRLVMDHPKLYVYNTSRSSVCFHAVGPSSLMSPQTTLAALGKVSDLFQVYNNFSVVDIETSCDEPKSVDIPVTAALASPTSLLLISILALGILLFSMICVYFCFIRRYRDYLRAKEKAMKGPLQTVPPTPTFVLTPPTPASPAMAPLGYWEG